MLGHAFNEGTKRSETTWSLSLTNKKMKNKREEIVVQKKKMEKHSDKIYSSHHSCVQNR